MDAEEAMVEPPQKRLRLSSPEVIKDSVMVQSEQNGKGERAGTDIEDENQLQKEIKAGITSYVSPNTLGFVGTLKMRYTDFLVNEILPSGKVLHLQEIGRPSKERDAESRPETVPTNSLKRKAEPTQPRPTPTPAVDATIQNGGGTEEAKDEVQNEVKDETPEADKQELQAIFGKDIMTKIIKFHGKVLIHPERKSKDFGTITSGVIEDKEYRTKAHQTVRRIFGGKLDTTTNSDNTIMISKGQVGSGTGGRDSKWTRNTAGKSRAKGKLGWDELGGEYLHFTMYKENKDTMEVIFFLASQLKFNNKNFQFAGTKDRRAVTVQRVSTYRVQADRLAQLNNSLRGSKIGDFKYEQTPLALGDLTGNEFLITLRDCHFPGEENFPPNKRLEHAKAVLSRAVSEFQEKGFINYYGLQRFGSFSTGTHEIGMKLLQNDLEGAVMLILGYNANILASAQGENDDTKVSSDDRNRALALHAWHTKSRSTKEVLDKMPRKFSAEANIIRHLGITKNGLNTSDHDWQGALSTIQRNLRLMYVHAYQSLVWNVVAGKRWERYGDKVSEGDLVIGAAKEDHAKEEVDDVGEVIINPGVDDSAATDGDYTRARPLSKEEAASGKYEMADVVLPLPGYDVVYPHNEIGAFYKEFMASERGGGLDPNDMRRKWKDLSLSGGYRRLLAKPRSDMEWEVRPYTSETEQLVETDLERLKASISAKSVTPALDSHVKLERADGEQKLAVILKMQLGSSTYATMALRELMKAGGVKSYKADFGRGT